MVRDGFMHRLASWNFVRMTEVWMDEYVCLMSINLSSAYNNVKIASLGGIEASIKAMSTHKDHNGVQEQACAALGNLAFNDGISCP